MRDFSLFLLGKGGVGKVFLRSLEKAQSVAPLRLVGVAGQKHFIFDPDGDEKNIFSAADSGDLSVHEKCEANPGLEKLFEKLSLKSGNLIVVDLTAAETGDFFAKLLSNGVHVVTANKRPMAGAREDFEKIKLYCNGGGPSLRYEATVGGGLPIVSTIVRLERSGDEIIDIRGILSGTLGFIMDEVSAGKPFSEAVREAHTLGYTEPDPRDDLSGADVARKALILARTLGGELGPEQISAQSLVPDGLAGVSAEDFLKKIRSEDAKYRRTERMAYVATITANGATLGVEQLSSGDPLYALNGPENMVSIRTKKYFKNPLVIRGPGAGAEVTSQGVMGDVLRILGKL